MAKIGIDVRMMTRLKTGVEIYTYYLIQNLGRIDKFNEYFLFSDKDFNNSDLPSSFNKRIIKFPPISFLWTQSSLFFALLRYRIDLYHSPTSAFALWGRRKRIVTIHDLSFLFYPEMYSKRRQLAHRFWLKRAVDFSDKIITVSKNTKEDIIKFYNAEPEKINVIHLGIDNKVYYPLKESFHFGQIQRKYNLPKRFIFAVGRLEPRKNFVNLIKAYAILKRKTDLKEKLVIIGNKGYRYKDIFKTVENLNLKKEVIFLGYVPQKDLPYIYNLASLFVYPSFYEGFGLPPLEAMACGIPVITSTTSSLPEVVGEAAILVNPYNVEEIAEAIYKVLSNKELAEKMRRKGLERAKQFSWEKCGRETLRVYEEVGKTLAKPSGAG